MADDGLFTVSSQHPVGVTIDRLETALREKNVTRFARIDHAAGAAAVGMSLRPMVVLIFGNPQGGTPLMQAKPTIGIDLPLKILIWEDADRKVWLTYTDPAWIARRHGLSPGDAPPVQAMATLLAQLTQRAAAP